MPDPAAEVAGLSERYAEAVDRADGDAVAQLFLPAGRMVVEPPAPAARQVIDGRDAIAARINSLRRYDRTAHLIGDHTVSLDGASATGTRECVAHHYGGEAGDGMDRVVVLTYHDTYERVDGTWSFAERIVRMRSEDILPEA